MKGMLIKDFSLLKGQKQFLLVAFVMAFVFLIVTNQYYFGVTYLIIMFVMFTLSTIAYDEYDNGNPFLFTLPVSRKGYVRGKYLFCLLTSLIGCAFDLILIVIMLFVKKDSEADLGLLLTITGAALVAGMLMSSLVIPLQLKFGSEKRQIAMVAGFLLIFLLIYGADLLVNKLEIPGFSEILGGISIEMLAVLAVLLVIALVFLSYLISVRIMEKKEF